MNLPQGVMDVNRIIVGTALALGCLLLAAGGGALYRHAVVLPGEQADKQALEAHSAPRSTPARWTAPSTTRAAWAP